MQVVGGSCAWWLIRYFRALPSSVSTHNYFMHGTIDSKQHYIEYQLHCTLRNLYSLVHILFSCRQRKFTTTSGCKNSLFSQWNNSHVFIVIEYYTCMLRMFKSNWGSKKIKKTFFASLIFGIDCNHRLKIFIF